jgi:flagellar basal-body rod protein FlgC
VIAENLANASSTGSKPGANPYRRHTISFADRLDSNNGLNLVTVSRIGVDPSSFPLKYQPSNPAANAQGYVKYPNVNSFVELMDMQQAQRSYDANLSVMNAARGMMTRTLGILQ